MGKILPISREQDNVVWGFHVWTEVYYSGIWYVYDPTDFNDGEGKYFPIETVYSSLSEEDKELYHLYLHGTGPGFAGVLQSQYLTVDSTQNSFEPSGIILYEYASNYEDMQSAYGL